MAAASQSSRQTTAGLTNKPENADNRAISLQRNVRVEWEGDRKMLGGTISEFVERKKAIVSR
jgi:hypothetical protein